MNTDPPVTRSGVYTSGNILLICGISAAYLLLAWLLVGFKAEQVFLVAFFNLFYFVSGPTRRFVIAFSIFILYWIIFDFMKAFPNYRFAEVHIADLYTAEKRIFGVSFNGERITPNEYWLRNGNGFLDILTGLFYLTWIPVPLGFAVYLYFKNRKQFFYFSLTFFLVNLLGFVIYYAYPAAPPWYVQQHGFVFYPHTPGNTAGLGRFDRYFHTGVFKSIYAKSSNIFAAMPSLHAAYPVIVLYYGLKCRLGLINGVFSLIMGGIWFSAIYNSHHYTLDILIGILCAFTGISLFNLAMAKNGWLGRLVKRLERITA